MYARKHASCHTHAHGQGFRVYVLAGILTHMHTRLHSKHVEGAAGFGPGTRGSGGGRGGLGEAWEEGEPSAAGRGDPRGSSWHRAHHTSPCSPV
jgi:hypothetical protein